MSNDLLKRLEDEEARMCRLWGVCADMHDKHKGTDAAFDFNTLKHAVSGRDPVLKEAAATIRALQEQVKTARDDALEEANKQTQELKDKLQRVGEAIPDRKELADHGMMVCDDISRRIRSLKANGESE